MVMKLWNYISSYQSYFLENFFINDVDCFILEMALFLLDQYFFVSFIRHSWENYIQLSKTEYFFGKYSPTWDSVWPWILLIVMAKKIINGNCRLWNLVARVELDGINVILGIKTWSPVCLPERILQFRTCVPIWGFEVVYHCIPLLIDQCSWWA